MFGKYRPDAIKWDCLTCAPLRRLNGAIIYTVYNLNANRKLQSIHQQINKI